MLQLSECLSKLFEGNDASSFLRSESYGNECVQVCAKKKLLYTLVAQVQFYR